MESYEIDGYYGSGYTPATVYVCFDRDLYWYAVDCSTIVNATYHPPTNGDWVEEFDDVDMFTWSSGIGSIDELIEAIGANC